MSKLSGVTVKGRIWGGFTLIIAFLVIVAALAVWGFNSVSAIFTEYDRIADNATRVMTIERNVVGLRRNVLVYTGALGDDKAMTRVRDLQGLLRKDLTDAVSATRSAERKAMLEQLSKLFEQYSANFEKVAELRISRDKAVNERLFPTGAEMRTRLTEMMDSAMADKDLETAVYAGKAQERLLLARLNANRFLATPDQKLADDARAYFTETEAALKTLVEHTRDARHKKVAQEVLGQVPVYAAAFGDVVSATLGIDRLVNKENAQIADQMRDVSGKVKQSQLESMNKLGGEAIDTATSKRTTSAVLSAIAVVLGLAFAYLIARSILVPIFRMTSAMGELAGGKLDVTVPALERTDEIGEMAKAVQVFKQNAVDKKRMEDEAEAARTAEAKAEAEQRAREVAIVAEVAEVAKAASEGDLDRRIELAGKDGFLLNLCEGVNNLVNLTGIALKDVAAVLASVARGDLTQRITNQYGGLFGQLKGDVNQTADKLFEIVTNINSGASQINSAASEVAAGSQDLSERSEQQ
ncbi:MAG TPA: HAMP domain-containing protein, partial [Magnetospirillum sp.]|nr:HAMP domain-containing protein [Magnetospirillum sp.]